MVAIKYHHITRADKAALVGFLRRLVKLKKIFIDGSAGTTGLRIYERIGGRTDIELIRLPEEERKDPACRREALNAADIAFLCLPDEAAIEAVGMIEDPDTVVIDTSTAHRMSARSSRGI